MADLKNETGARVTWTAVEESAERESMERSVDPVEGTNGPAPVGTLRIEQGRGRETTQSGFFPVTTLVYDGTFGGYLTAIFVVYSEYRGVASVDIIPPERHQPGIFQTERIVDHDPVLADRVWNGILNHLSREQAADIYATFLGESPAREGLMLDYIRKVFATGGEVASDYLDKTARMIRVWGRRVRRQKSHIESTLRFSESSTGEYYGLIEPDYDVLPLVVDHFGERYAGEPWVIYDIRRGYGIHDDGEGFREVTLDGVEGDPRHFFNLNPTDRNPLFQKLWKERGGEAATGRRTQDREYVIGRRA